MSYLALYRKYRPHNFEDMVDQNEVIEVIKREILNNKVSHAYLFAGPRGTGKTTTAKIMARMVNCENLGSDGMPCGVCESCKNFDSSSDIVEIDAASNNGVDEIRELRDKVNLVPSGNKYKVYIIDEVHMLTTQAFNALLKTLEEPPSHVIFILATTEFFKIPVTVVSRCQKFQFTRVSNDAIVSRLKTIAKLENIDVDDDSLFEIARLSDGGMRDAINMLDQLSSFGNGKIVLDDIYKLSGTYSYEELYKLVSYLFNKEYDNIISFSENVNTTGKNVSKFLEEFLYYIRDVIYFKTTGTYNNIENENIEKISNLYSVSKFYDLMLYLNDLLTNIKGSTVPYVLLGVSLIKISENLSVDVKKDNNDNNKEVKNNVTDTKDADNSSCIVSSNSTKTVDNNNFFDEKKRQLRINNTFSSASKEKLLEVKESWKNLDNLLLDAEYGAIAGMLKDVDIIVAGDNNLMLLAKYDTLLDRLYANILAIEKLIYNLLNKEYRVVFLANDEWKYEKSKYIENIQKGYKYVYVEEKNDELDKSLSKGDSDIDKIIDIIGSDKIEYI